MGPVTAEAVKKAGFPLSKVAAEFRTAAIPKALGRIQGRQILLARVRGAPLELERELVKRGARVEKLSTYETIFVNRIPAPLKQRILSGVDWVTFTSSSTVHSFMRLFSSKERKRFSALPEPRPSAL